MQEPGTFMLDLFSLENRFKKKCEVLDFEDHDVFKSLAVLY